MKRILKTTLISAVALSLLSLVVYSYMPKPILVDVEAVRRAALRIVVQESGKTRVRDRFVVSAPITGNLARMELRSGDPVHEGMVIARLLPSAAPLLDAKSRAEAEARVGAASSALQQSRAAVARATASLELARGNARRKRELARTSAISQWDLELAEMEERVRQSELDSARFAAHVTEHDLEMARVAVRRGGTARLDEVVEIASPIKGQVLRVLQQSEGIVNSGTSIVELGDPNALEIVADVLTSDAVQIQPGMKALVEEWGGPKPLRAQVRLVEPSAFTRISALGVEEQGVNVLLDFLDPPEAWSALGDGYRVEVSIAVNEIQNALIIPESSLFRGKGGWAVYVVQKNRARIRNLDLAERGDYEVAIDKGLSPGEVVIRHPSDAIEEGVSVETR